MTHRYYAVQIVAAAITLLSQQAAFADTLLRVVERATTDRVSVHGGKGADNVGDILTFANPVFDAANRIQLGTDQGYCVRVVLGRAYECHWTLSLAAGQLTVDGPFMDAADSVLAVTGGTGAYRGARGEMGLHARDAKGQAYDFAYRLK